MIRKAYTARVEPLGERTIRAICSTGAVDRMGEVVTQTGADLSLYKDNPIVLFSHDPHHPIGVATDVQIVNGELIADIKFADEGVSQKADEVYRLVKADILKSISIGFDPTQTEPMDPSRPRGPQRYLKWALCEISVVAIPANPNAVITDKAYSDEDSETTMATTKTGPSLKIKGLYEIGQLAGLMNQLGWQHDDSCWEAQMEGDGSKMPQMLADILHSMGSALIAMTQEEVSECLAAIDAKMPDPGADPEPDKLVLIQHGHNSMRRKLMSAVTRSSAIAPPNAHDIALQAAMDSHDMCRKAFNFHTSCMKDLAENPADDAMKTGAKNSHDMLCKAMNFHAKCMKSLTEPDGGQALEAGAEDSNDPAMASGEKSAGIDKLVTKEQRMRYARAVQLKQAAS